MGTALLCMSAKFALDWVQKSAWPASLILSNGLKYADRGQRKCDSPTKLCREV